VGLDLILSTLRMTDSQENPTEGSLNSSGFYRDRYRKAILYSQPRFHPGNC